MSDDGRETLELWRREWKDFRTSVDAVLEGREK
jgi:DNA-binding PadR family transcriptional regulator